MSLTYWMEQVLRDHKDPMSVSVLNADLIEITQKNNRRLVFDEDRIIKTAKKLPEIFVLQQDVVSLASYEDRTSMSWETHVRMRPGMYIGGPKDVIEEFTGNLLSEAIAISGSDKVFVSYTIKGENNHIVELTSEADLSEFIDFFYEEKMTTRMLNSRPMVSLLLVLLSDDFKLTYEDQNSSFREGKRSPKPSRKNSDPIKSLRMQFSFDTYILDTVRVDYWIMSSKLSQLAILNRNLKILLRDERSEYPNQSFFHFPSGILTSFQRQKMESFQYPVFDFTYDGEVNGNKYLIGIAFRTDWFPQPVIAAYANDIPMENGSLLADGIIDGLMAATKKYVKYTFPEFADDYKEMYSKTSPLSEILLAGKEKKESPQFKIKRKKFMNGLMLLAAVRGQEIVQRGDNGRIEIEQIRTDTKKEMAIQFLNYFKANKAVALNFLWRFDETQFGSAMF